MVEAQTAKSMSYDNQIKATDTFFQKRQRNRMYKAAERGPRQTQVVYNKWAKDSAPDRLNASQINSVSGQINWPVVLRGEAYRANRTRIDALYASHAAAGGGMGTNEYAQIKGLAREMQSQLRQNISNITPEQYSYARKFLEGLGYEARHGAGR